MLLPDIKKLRHREETPEGDGYVHGLDGGDGFMGVYSASNSFSCKHYINTYFYISIILLIVFFKIELKNKF